MSLFSDARQDGGVAANGFSSNGHSSNGHANNSNGSNGFSENGYSRNGGQELHGTSPAAGSFVAATPAMYAEYAGAVQRTLNRMPWNLVHAVVQAIVQTWQNGGQLLVMGNGGSASTATHLACDLGKNTAQPGLPRIRALALNDNMALMSAYANDVGYDAVFSEQLRAIAQPGDLVLAISTSGNSPNVLRALEMARKLNLQTIGLGGYDGGKMSGIVDLAVIAPNHCVEQIEDIHMMLAHVITVGVRNAMQAALVRGDEFEDRVRIYDGMIATPAQQPATNGVVNAASNGQASNGQASNGQASNGYVGSSRIQNGSTGVHGTNVVGPSYVPPQTGIGYWQNNMPAVNGHD